MKLAAFAGVGALAAAAVLASSPAQATVYVADAGGTTFTITTVSSTEFTFDITDPTAGWSGAASLGSFAFNDNIFGSASGLTATETSPGSQAGITVPGGLNSGGCNGHGAFVCFEFTPSVAVASNMDFDIKASGGAFDFSNTNVPDLKIQFLDSTGGKTGSLFSADVPLSTNVPVPEPATWLMMIAGVGAIGGMLRMRRTTETATV